MMKKLLSCFLSFVVAVFLFSGSALCQDMSKQEIIKELNALKERAKRLEEALMALDETETPVEEEAEEEAKHEIQHGNEMATNENTEPLEKYMKGVELSGTIEVEAVYEHFDPKGDKKENSSDLTLETVDLAVDALLIELEPTSYLSMKMVKTLLLIKQLFISRPRKSVCLICLVILHGTQVSVG